MNNKEVFKIWSPVGARWVEWIKPVLFISINDNIKTYSEDIEYKKISYIENIKKDTAIIVDYPGEDGINEGLSLAKIGYRLVPLYNGTVSQKDVVATIDNYEIQMKYITGAIELKKIEVEDNAPPAFLLDTNRLNRFKMNVSIFDNSWDIYEQDFPTSKYFLENGIKNIIVSSNKIEKDLKYILYKFQKSGIKLYHTDGYEQPKEIRISGIFLKEKI